MTVTLEQLEQAHVDQVESFADFVHGLTARGARLSHTEAVQLAEHSRALDRQHERLQAIRDKRTRREIEQLET